MAYTEVQFSTATFLRAQLRQAQGTRICLPDAENLGGVSVQLQRISFGANEIRHSIPDEFTVYYNEGGVQTPTPYPATGRKTQLAQQIKLAFALTDQILDHPNQAAPIVYEVALTVVYELAYRPDLDGGCMLYRYFDAFEWAALPPIPPGLGVSEADLKQKLGNLLRTRLPAKAVPLNFGSLLPGGVGGVMNAGLSVDGLQRVAFRTDPAPGNTKNDQRWTNFYLGANIFDRIHGADWGVFIEGKVIESLMTVSIEAGIKKKGIPGLTLSSAGTQYVNAGGIPRTITTLHMFGPADVYLQLPITADYSVDNARQLLVVDVHLDQIQQLLDDVVGWLKSLGPAWLLIDAIAGDDIAELADALGGIDPPSVGSFTSEKISNTHYRMTGPLPTPGIDGGRLRLTAMVAEPDGMSLTGILSGVAYTPSEVTMEPSNFAWIPPHMSCGQGSEAILDAARENPAAFATLYAQVEVEPTGTAPVFICDVTVLDNGPGFYPAFWPGISRDRDLLPATVMVKMPPAGPTSPAPYDLKLLISTTAGKRLVQIPPPAPITEVEKTLIVATIKLNLQRCDLYIPEWFGDDGKFDLSLIVDPLLDPPLEILDGHFWRIEVQGLAAGQTATLRNEATGALVQAMAETDGPLTLSAYMPADVQMTLLRDATPLSLGLSSPFDMTLRPLSARSSRRSAWPGKRAARGVEMRCQSLLRAARITLGSPARRLAPAPGFGHAALVAVLEDEVAAYDLTNPYAPQRIGSWHAPGVAGVRPWRGGLLGFGDNGFFALNGELGRVALRQESETGPIRDVTFAGDTAYVLTDTALEVRTLGLRTLSTVPVEGGRSLFHAGDRLLVGGQVGVEIIDLAQPRTATRRRGRAIEADVARLAPHGPGRASVLVMLSDGSARGMRLAGNRLVNRAVYATPPWFADGVAVGRCIVRLSGDRRQLLVSTLGEERLVVPFPDRAAKPAPRAAMRKRGAKAKRT